MPGMQIQPYAAAQDASNSDALALARRLLIAESESVRTLADTLNQPFLDAVSLIVRCADGRASPAPGSLSTQSSNQIPRASASDAGAGTVLVTGLGKSGLIGQKISATLASLAITSHFVHPAEAAHGDLGRFRPNDLCIALSYSGETDEVVALASILRQDAIPIIAITRGSAHSPGSHNSRHQAAPSSLERLANVALSIGDCDKPEISPAPTCSTTAMLALGDALALAAAHRRNFTNDDFAKRHPGGSLGGLLRPVADILRFKVGVNLEALPDSLTVSQALRAADHPGQRRPGAMLLVNQTSGTLAGIFTDGDLRRLILRATTQPALDLLNRPIRDFMTKAPTTLSDQSLVRDAVFLVRENRRDEIPVVDSQGKPVGILDVQDLIAMKLIKD